MGYLTCGGADVSVIRWSADDPDSSPTQLRRFSYRDIEKATGSFSGDALLGRGSHGAVYKVTVGGETVAVKRPSRSRREVENEIRILSRIRGPGFVNLIGVADCPPPGDGGRLLVVEFMPNGTLYDLLHRGGGGAGGWLRRLRFAMQVARALAALHAAHPPVIHRDVKSANVLLDGGFTARLGDFGLAVRERVDSALLRSTPPAGTLGYLDPGYVTTEHLSTKTDVFSFGILLLEIISGRRAMDVAHSPPSVVDWAAPLLARGKFSSLFDPRLPPPRDPAVRRRIAALAAGCVRASSERRPSMAAVAEQLKVICKTVPSGGAWGMIGTPCAIVDTEKAIGNLTLIPAAKGEPRKTGRVFSDATETTKDSKVEEETAVLRSGMRVRLSGRPIISRAMAAAGSDDGDGIRRTPSSLRLQSLLGIR